MVEIRSGEHYEVTDLSGKTVAEAREQFKEAFGISDKAQVRLGGKKISRKQETDTWLGADDRLSFVKPSRRGLFFIASVLLAMVVTGSVFAYGATTTTVGLTLTGKSDFAAVAAAGSLPTWNVWGSYKGQVTAGDIFTITPETDFTGDMVAVLVLTNAYDLVEAYRMLALEIEIWDSTSGTKLQAGTTEYLTLAKGECSIEIDQTGLTAPYTVQIVNGFYITHRGGWGSDKEDPTILCDVLQKGV